MYPNVVHLANFTHINNKTKNSKAKIHMKLINDMHAQLTKVCKAK